MFTRSITRQLPLAMVATALVLAGTVLSGATALAQDESSIAGKKLVFITYGNASEYQIAQGEWFKQFAEEEGASVAVIDGKFDPLAQVKGIEDSVAAGVDAIVIQPFDTIATAPAIQAAREAGVIVGIAGALPDASTVVPAIGTFNDESLVREAARDAASWLQENKPGEKAKIVLFDIFGNVVCHDWRMAAFRDELVQTIGEENIEDVYNDTTTHTLDWITRKMEDIIQSGRDLNIFTACGGTGAVGGLNALTEAGKAVAADGAPQDIWVLSIDATPDELTYLVNPDVSLMETIALTPKTNAQVFLDNLKKIFAGEIDPDSDFVMPAPGILFHKADGCQAISDTLADQYAIVPGYQALACE